MYKAMSACQALHPDPEDIDSEEEEEKYAYEEEEEEDDGKCKDRKVCVCVHAFLHRICLHASMQTVDGLVFWERKERCYMCCLLN